MTTLVALLSVYLFSVVLLRIRNADRLDLKHQFTNFSTFMVIFNIPAYLLSRVPLSNRIDKSYYPELTLLEENWEVVREEALELYRNGYIAIKDDLPASSFYRDDRWTSFYLKIYDNEIPSAYELAPRTMELLDQMPSMRIALFACLNPGKKLRAHHDPFAYTLRYSLGLSTPNSDQCGLKVDGEDYKWHDGDSIIFDETFLHSAYNNSDTPRIILMTDIDRPMEWAWVQKFYYFFGWFFNRLFAIDNVDSGKTGVGNKLGKGLKAYQGLLKRFKNWNRPLYVASKLLILAVVVIWLVLAIA
jgi:beta-hydroxylase